MRRFVVVLSQQPTGQPVSQSVSQRWLLLLLLSHSHCFLFLPPPTHTHSYPHTETREPHPFKCPLIKLSIHGIGVKSYYTMVLNWIPMLLAFRVRCDHYFVSNRSSSTNEIYRSDLTVWLAGQVCVFTTCRNANNLNLNLKFSYLW